MCKTKEQIATICKELQKILQREVFTALLGKNTKTINLFIYQLQIYHLFTFYLLIF